MQIPRTAMVLAAGLGTRMRPLTDTKPKPLVEVAGKPLVDHVLDRLADAGVERAVVNVHYLAEQIIAHVAARRRPRVTISDERGLLLGTGGGVVKALPELGIAPFFHINSDTIWIDGVRPNLARLAEAPGVKATEPLGYTDFMSLVFDCRYVLTDSGGIQEETTYLGIPCLTLRENTERPITVTQGTNRLVRAETVQENLEAILAGKWPKGTVPPLWDGKTAARVARSLKAAAT